jgi:hypothetical protein
MRESPELKEKYRDRLKKIIGTKIQTTMIFPLSVFEAAFGTLWGYGKNEESLTEEEKVYRKKWNLCRESILNTGNQQKRNAFVEIDMYDVVWLGYQTLLVPMEKYQEIKKNEEK